MSKIVKNYAFFVRKIKKTGGLRWKMCFCLSLDPLMSSSYSVVKGANFSRPKLQGKDTATQNVTCRFCDIVGHKMNLDSDS